MLSREEDKDRWKPAYRADVSRLQQCVYENVTVELATLYADCDGWL